MPTRGIAGHQHGSFQHANRPYAAHSFVNSPAPTRRNDRTEIEDLKENISFVSLLKADGHRVYTSGKHPQCCCPFHPDRTPSFTIYDDRRAFCFGCEWKGDVIKYLKDSRNLSFPETIHLLRGVVPSAASQKRSTQTELPPSGPSDASDITPQLVGYCERLRDDPWLCTRVASSRPWHAETIQKLAADGHLGWAGDALTFVYERGAKLRHWPGREMRWEGIMTAPWRAGRIHHASQVFLTEGETDAITLLDCGLESDIRTAVVAAPGAKIFKQEWAHLFRGKEVTVCYDSDEAGETGAVNVIRILKPVAAKVFNVSLKGVA